MRDHFKREEFRCRCAERSWFKWLGCGGSAPVSLALVDALEELRIKAGSKPVQVLSGFRCLTYNRKIGSSDGSQHPRGTAADIRIKGLTPDEVAIFARQVPAFQNGGIGVYVKDNFTHVDVRGVTARWRG